MARTYTLRKDRIPNFTCQECGQEVYIKPSGLKKGRKYCTPDCEHAIQRTGEIRECQRPECEEIFYVGQSYIVRGGGKYCSPQCFYEHQRDQNRRNRKHGLLTTYIHRGCRCAVCKQAYSKYRKLKYTKGCYKSTCQECGETFTHWKRGRICCSFSCSSRRTNRMRKPSQQSRNELGQFQ